MDGTKDLGMINRSLLIGASLALISSLAPMESPSYEKFRAPKIKSKKGDPNKREYSYKSYTISVTRMTKTRFKASVKHTMHRLSLSVVETFTSFDAARIAAVGAIDAKRF